MKNDNISDLTDKQLTAALKKRNIKSGPIGRKFALQTDILGFPVCRSLLRDIVAVLW